jgi:hypothetical protein
MTQRRPSLLLGLVLNLVLVPGLGHWHGGYRRRALLFLVPAVAFALTLTVVLTLDVAGAMPDPPPLSPDEIWATTQQVEDEILQAHGRLYAALLWPLGILYIGSGLDWLQLALRGYPGRPPSAEPPPDASA